MSIRSSGIPNGSTAASIRSTAMSASASVAPSAGEPLDDGGPEPAADAGDRDHASVELAHQAAAPAAAGSRDGRPSSAGWSFGASCV